MRVREEEEKAGGTEKLNVKYSLGKTKVEQYPMKPTKKKNSRDYHPTSIRWSRNVDGDPVVQKATLNCNHNRLGYVM